MKKHKNLTSINTMVYIKHQTQDYSTKWYFKEQTEAHTKELHWLRSYHRKVEAVYLKHKEKLQIHIKCHIGWIYFTVSKYQS
jgi:hypothetical protein